MKAIFLTSGPEFSIKNENGERKAVKLANINLVENLKREIDKFDNIVFVCSTPDDYKRNEDFAKIITKSLSLSGIKFVMGDLIDSRNWLFSKSLITNADLIVLLGGDPLEQMEFFNNIQLREKLKKYKGCILGISAGTINMAKSVYCSKDDDVEESIDYKGLGIVDINVEPHFDIEDSERINTILLPDSQSRKFVALPNDSFIMIKENNVELYGEAYYFNEGQYKKIDNEEIKTLY